MKLYLFTITISFFALLSTSLVYGEENINNKNNIQQNSNTTATNKVIGYKFEPFLLLDGEDFEDISQNDKFVLQNFAITAWINTNQSSLLEPAHIVNKGGFNTDEKGENMNYGIWFSVDGTISGGFETESGEDFEVKSTAKYNDGKWHYVLLSYDGSLLRLDIDGQKQISTTTKNTNGVIPDTTGDQPLRIGANSLDKSKFFTGNIDEVRIWNRGLTDQEISEIYTNNVFDSNGQIIYLDFGGDGTTINNNKSSDIADNTAAIVKEEEEEGNLSSELSTQKIMDKKEGTEQGEGPSNDITNTVKDFNIAVSADWGCEEDTKKTAENIQKKSPELVIAAGDLSYDESSNCWFEIIEPFKSRMKIAMGDHEYSDTSGGAIGIVNQYLKPLNLTKTYYSFDMNNVHFTFIDPYIDYKPGSAQYQLIENELKTASTNPKIDWTFVVESIPIYTSPTQHPGNSTIRDIYHPLFEKYGVDIVFTSDNHNYQRTFPLKYNSYGGNYSSNSPIISNNDKNNYNADNGVIYLITGTAGRSLNELKQQAPFVAKQQDKHFGFINIDIIGNTLKGTFYANESELPRYHYVNYQGNTIIDQFTISKINTPNNNEFNKL
ncbi:MAG TPA: LamG-like jellyroll fold domain-containing protein [Nitrososphaeraceae archaeon]|nr:LamG-like jellyroll fold domain-containing protein [Nitrososphaeraceae archaeon]